MGLLSNTRLFLVVMASFSLQLLAHHLPVLERLFGTQPITFAQCASWILLGLVPVSVLELIKLARRPRHGLAVTTDAAIPLRSRVEP